MPKQYEAIRDKLKAEGKPLKEAQRIAAATYNKNRGSKPPVTGKPHGKRQRTSPA